MKRTICILYFTVVSLLLAGAFVVNTSVAQETGKMMTATGKVTNIDPGGNAITIDTTAGNATMNVGTIVSDDTRITVRDKPASLDDIKEGDTVTIRYLKSDDLYAKQITKK
ncbi:MAG TPA: hypothetical protein VHO84_06555 [Syntrophorhabdaceae bacterium]|nr:hypothetical protein [Syntrophorhabdaceae bacterium]